MPQGLLPFTTDHPHQSFIDNQPGCLTKAKRRFFYVLDGNPRRLKTLSVLLLAVCSLFYLIFFVFVNNDAIEEETPNIVLPDSLIKKRLDFESVTIDMICSRISKTCYNIVDKKTAKGVERHLIFDNGLPDESDTAVFLVPPKGESFDTSDTRIWQVDHSKITSQYVAGMLVAPFMVSVLDIEGNGNGKSLLEIGLGGGSLDMALHTAKPKINITAVEMDPTIVEIAEKWFGVLNNENHRTIASDGVEFVANIAKNRDKFDVIVLDACDDDVIIPCPAEAFRQEKVINDIKNGLTSSGVLVVNILAHDEDDIYPTHTQKAISAFTKIFPTCLQLKMSDELNTILACLPYTIGDSEEQLKFYSTRLQSAITSLGLQYILGNVAVARTS